LVARQKFGRTTQIWGIQFWSHDAKLGCATQNSIVRHKIRLCDTKFDCATQN
jgi:hypothetical protein